MLEFVIRWREGEGERERATVMMTGKVIDAETKVASLA